jgi:carboxypeptidase Taq
MQSVKEWLNEHVYTYGSVYKPKDLLVKVTGKPLDSSYFANYLKTKYIDGGMA